jgi:AraC family transcriptional regulator, regulatory protein of adaptative response / DNA-3-methyladenine glycosylase II
VRQFNDTVREVYATSPSELRGRSGRRPTAGSGAVAVRLPARTPFAGGELFRFVAAHAVPGVEHGSAEGVLSRSLSLPRAQGTVALAAETDGVRAQLRLADWRDLAPAVERIRRWLDLDADPVAVDAVLGADDALAPSVDALPGLRSTGSVDPFEAAVRTVIGQQVSVAAAATVTGRIATALGEPLTLVAGPLTHVFPTPERLAAVDPDQLPMPRRRAATVVQLARAVVAGEVVLDRSTDRAELRHQLAAVPGIGRWSITHIEMRGFGDPDVFLDGDLVARRGLERLGLVAADAARWRPWRSYAIRHLWNTVWRST